MTIVQANERDSCSSSASSSDEEEEDEEASSSSSDEGEEAAAASSGKGEDEASSSSDDDDEEQEAHSERTSSSLLDNDDDADDKTKPTNDKDSDPFPSSVPSCQKEQSKRSPTARTIKPTPADAISSSLQIEKEKSLAASCSTPSSTTAPPPSTAATTPTPTILTAATFAKLGVVETLVQACTDLGWHTATRIQEQVIPLALAGKDIIGLAETGSGKTGAFCVPLLQHLLQPRITTTTNTTTLKNMDAVPSTSGAGEMGSRSRSNSGVHPTTSRKGIAGLILTPTRELAFQIQHVCQALSVRMGATSVCIVGGVDRASQALALARTPHVVIATPGRLLDHLKSTKGFHLRRVQCLVLDEADRMLGLDFEEELHHIIDQLPLSSSEQPRQTLLFSATMTSQVQKLQRASLRKEAVKVQVNEKFQTPVQLQQYYIFVPAKYKDAYLTFFMNEFAGHRVLVFCATCATVQRVALLLRNLGFHAGALHGQMAQPQRLGMLNQFARADDHPSSNTSIIGVHNHHNHNHNNHNQLRRHGRLLICTDVASRGLDLPTVDYVINYDLPGHGKEYIHRVGRTARAGQRGTALSMVTQYDVEVYQRVEHLLGKKLPEYPTDEATVLILLERVSEAQRLATRELKEQLAVYNRHGRNGHRSARQQKRKMMELDDDKDGGDDPLEHVLKKQLKRGYAGGSGGHGGALHNQRGSFKQSRKYRK